MELTHPHALQSLTAEQQPGKLDVIVGHISIVSNVQSPEKILIDVCLFIFSPVYAP